MIHYYFVAHAPSPWRSKPPKCISLRAWSLASWAKVYISSPSGLFIHAFLFCIDSSLSLCFSLHKVSCVFRSFPELGSCYRAQAAIPVQHCSDWRRAWLVIHSWALRFIRFCQKSFLHLTLRQGSPFVKPHIHSWVSSACVPYLISPSSSYASSTWREQHRHRSEGQNSCVYLIEWLANSCH